MVERGRRGRERDGRTKKERQRETDRREEPDRPTGRD